MWADKQVSEKFKSIHEVPDWLKHEIPVSHEIRLIRQALGMSQEQLADKIGSHQHFIAHVENDSSNDVRLSTLKKIAQGLGCELVVNLVPKKIITETLEDKSLEVARKLISVSSGNACMEMQLPEPDFIQDQVKELQGKILSKYRSSLWQTV